MRVLLRPRFDWGRDAAARSRRAAPTSATSAPAQTLRLNTDAPTRLHPGRDLLRGRPADELHPGPRRDADRRHRGHGARASSRRPAAYWRNWSRALSLPLEWQDAVIRAAITLKLSLFEDTGAIVAAMTTSIPEAPDSGRNWDYRFCWLRDAFFVVRALNSHLRSGDDGGLPALADQRGGALRRRPHPAAVRHRPGGAAARVHPRAPARLPRHGAGARGQPGAGALPARRLRQHRARRRAGLPRPPAAAPRRPRRVRATWKRSASRPSASTTSPTPACGSCARARASTPRRRSCAGPPATGSPRSPRRSACRERVRYWRERADTIRERILRESWSEERQAFAESFGGRDLDASVLLMAEVGFIDPNDPRFVSTVDALEKSLCDGPYMRRYEARRRFRQARDRLQHLHLLAHRRAGAHRPQGAGARDLRGDARAAATTLGLLSEDTHPVTGEMWGNFPQTYSMVGIDQRRGAPVGAVGHGRSGMIEPPGRRLQPRRPIRARRARRRAGRGAGRRAEQHRRPVVRLERQDRRADGGTPAKASVHMQQAGNGDAGHGGPRRSEDHDAYYLGYSNGVLWPVFHYRLDLADFDAGYIARLPAREPAVRAQAAAAAASPTTSSGCTTTT